MTTVCIERPNRSKKRTFTERDVGRIIAHAREDGANDILMLAYVMDGFGLRNIACIAFEVLGILNQAFFLGAIIGALNGVSLIIKGLKLLLTKRRSTIPGIVELIVPRRWLGSLGQFLLGLGAFQILISGGVVFLTSLANNVELVLLTRGICRAELRPVSPAPVPLRVGNLQQSLAAFSAIFKLASDEIERGM